MSLFAMSLFARILPALVTAAAMVAVPVGMALPASPGAARLAASGEVLTHCHHWHDGDDNDNDQYDQYDHDRDDHYDRALIELHDLL
jgi:hypothetical protein